MIKKSGGDVFNTKKRMIRPGGYPPDKNSGKNGGDTFASTDRTQIIDPFAITLFLGGVFWWGWFPPKAGTTPTEGVA